MKNVALVNLEADLQDLISLELADQVNLTLFLPKYPTGRFIFGNTIIGDVIKDSHKLANVLDGQDTVAIFLPVENYLKVTQAILRQVSKTTIKRLFWLLPEVQTGRAELKIDPNWLKLVEQQKVPTTVIQLVSGVGSPGQTVVAKQTSPQNTNLPTLSPKMITHFLAELILNAPKCDEQLIWVYAQ